MSKIFGIGLNKTGTSTLGVCLKILGYNHTSCSRKLLKDISQKQKYDNTYETVDKFDSFEDWPWPLIYKKLDNKYPNSKFILTIRKDEFTWLNSLKKHSLTTTPLKNCRKYAYGYEYPFCHEKEHIKFYKDHNNDVKEHFKNRPKDFLIVCWENGDGWEELCNFLSKKVPKMPFPHINKSSSKNDNIKTKIYKIVNKILSHFL